MIAEEMTDYQLRQPLVRQAAVFFCMDWELSIPPLKFLSLKFPESPRRITAIYLALAMLFFGNLSSALEALDGPRELFKTNQFRTALTIRIPGTEVRLGRRKVYYDYNNDRFSVQSQWLTPDSPFLVRILREDSWDYGRVSLFGAIDQDSFEANPAPGFTMLARYDGNSDGVIDANDHIWADLRLWFDKNSNGVVDDGELRRLDEYGISALMTDSKNTDSSILPEQYRIGKYLFGGVSSGHGEVVEILLEVDVYFSKFHGEKPLSKEVRAMPTLSGMGKLPDLRQAMELDSSRRLYNLVKEFCQEEEIERRPARFTVILFAWTNLDYKIIYESMKEINIENKIAILEKIYGTKIDIKIHNRLTMLDSSERKNIGRYFDHHYSALYAKICINAFYASWYMRGVSYLKNSDDLDIEYIIEPLRKSYNGSLYSKEQLKDFINHLSHGYVSHGARILAALRNWAENTNGKEREDREFQEFLLRNLESTQ